MTLSRKAMDWGEDTYWEKVARSRWGRYITRVENRVLLKANNLAGRPSTVLDVGCEGGRWSKLLVDRGWQATCTDIDPQALVRCQERLPAARCILVDKQSTTLPCATASMGLILCIEVIPVLGSGWFINEARRVLKDGGLVVGVFENRLSLRGYFRHLVAATRGRFDYYKTAYPAWRREFRRRSFNMIYEEGICWFPFTRASNSPLVPLCTRLERYLGLRRLPSLSPWIVFLAQKQA
ncbi:MAG: class I SAM-dependent methyltransferase [Anaerolineae bacterium]